MKSCVLNKIDFEIFVKAAWGSVVKIFCQKGGFIKVGRCRDTLSLSPGVVGTTLQEWAVEHHNGTRKL
jgi:hypothetical protein